MKKYCLIGKNLSYSYSKLIHDYLINYYGLDASYDLIETETVNLELLKKYDGLTVTMPYKAKVLEFVDENTTSLPANTILNNNGYLTAYNTDIMGFEYLVNLLNDIEINKVVILGSGASSKMVQKFFNDKEVIVISRESAVHNYETVKDIHADLLVNTTPIGMSENKSPIAKENLTNFKAVLDLNYNPINSRLGFDAKHLNIPYHNGLYMLIVQAIESFKIWHKIAVDEKLLLEIYPYILSRTQTKVALIGMPLSGKTTIAKKFNGADLDQVIIEKYQTTVAKMIEEGVFRKNEHDTLCDLVERNEKFIACGGGAVLDYKNLECLRDYIIIYLKEELEVLDERRLKNFRPLLKSREDLERTLNDRIGIYNKYSNLTLCGKEVEELLNILL